MGCDGGEAENTGGGGQGGNTTTSSTTGSTSTSSEGGGGSGGGLTCENDEGPVVAVSQLTFGEGDTGEWKKFGFNIDGLISTAVSNDVCKPNNDALPIGPYPDGDGGIDNSFGKNLLPLILAVRPTWVDDINNGIDNGYFTTLMKMECLPEKGDVPKFTSKLFGGATLASQPKFDGSDVWPVTPELLSDPSDPLSSTVVFDHSSVEGAEFDTGYGNTFILAVPLKAQNGNTTTIKLTLYNARVTMKLSEDRKSATGGIIGGALNTEELMAELNKVGALLGMCGTAQFKGLLDEVRRASDIMSDGTQDPTKVCDGISIGVGFEMMPVQLGEVGPPSPVGDSCQ